MSAYNPLIDTDTISPYGSPVVQPTTTSTMTSTTSRRNAADVQGTGSLTGTHNTPLHVATLAFVCVLIIIGYASAGFKFAIAGKIR